jgi:predicted dehydrogenase
MQTSRRTFLQAAAVATAGYGRLAAAPPSDRIRVGFIGLGRQGTGRLNQFMQERDVVAAAVCDVDRTHLEKAAGLVNAAQGHKPDTYGDFRRLLDRKDIDAVMVATPDHWHALPAIMACQSGKDVFVEKPLSYSIGEGRAIVRAALAHNRVTQMGNHIHNDHANYRRVVEIVRSGMLGPVRRVYCSLAGGAAPVPKVPDSAPPAELDYEFWLGPAPKRPYNAARTHFSYRYFWDYSGGAFIDFWCHYADVAYWALDLQAPKSVAAAGGRWNSDDNAETPDNLELLYEYPNVVLTWTLHPQGRPGYDHMGSSVIFEGSEGTLVTNYTRHELYVKKKLVEGFKRPPQSIPDSPGHIREFLNAVKSRERCTCDVEYGHKLTKAGLLGNLAYRTGERLYWDDAHERVQGHSRAAGMVTRRYRKPWKLV